MLNPTVTTEGMLWSCETCSGVAVNVAVLRKCLGVKMVREFWFKATNESKASNRTCPSCDQKLKEFAVGQYNRKVQLDLCKRCQLIWFDRNELQMFPGSENVQPDPAKYVATSRDVFKVPYDDVIEPERGFADLCLRALCVAIRLFLFRR